MKTYYIYIILPFLMWAYMYIMGPKRVWLADVNSKE